MKNSKIDSFASNNYLWGTDRLVMENGASMSNKQSTAEKCDSHGKRLTHFCFYGLVFGAGIGIVLGSALDAIPLGLTFGPAIGLATGWVIFRCKT